MKEQLKKMGSFEYHQSSFSYIDNETRDECYAGMPEEGGRNAMAADPLPWSASRSGPRSCTEPPSSLPRSEPRLTV